MPRPFLIREKMKIQKINIKNFKMIDSFEAEVHGKSMYLIAGNEEGKTSILDAIWGGLGGARSMPPKPLKDGARQGLIELDLGDIIARTIIKKGKKVELQLENKNYSDEANRFISSPRAYLDNLIGVIDFNINDFFALTPQKKMEYLGKVLSQDFSVFDADIKEAEESRAFDKKRLLELNANFDYYDAKLLDKKPVDLIEVTNLINDEVRKSETVKRIEDGIGERVAMIAEIDRDIFDIKAKIERLEKSREVKEKEIEDAKAWLLVPKNIPDLIGLEKLREDQLNSDKLNKEIAEAKKMSLIDLEIKELEKSITEQNEYIKETRLKKATAISSAIEPIGLTFDEASNKLTYKGHPFDAMQINTASQLILGMKMASTLLKDLKIVRVDATLIDNKNFAKVLEWSKEQDIEMFIELVDRDGAELQVKLID
ncbi:hypothetical protein Phi12:1_gp8 [Cellulophaga phage phi12:1]|uniref:Uncharacterized protein n=2 Tax=Cellulophaga phage phi12:1 TaxID=1327976 RepID=R9ZXI5_9CAUD|nr:hypothetical protein Phi12:1_gp8 [Cellulophaga phage phi12:1]AGO47974.1 hypothetical protein Phi12:1_gp8 [Cellulophaga phage phi12:1]